MIACGRSTPGRSSSPSAPREGILRVTDAVRRISARGRTPVATPDDPLPLVGGGSLERVRVAWEATGTLDPAHPHVVLVCHALTGDAHVVRQSPTDRPGWWEWLVGPDRPIDTNRCLVVASNVLGGCAGTTGPTSWRRRADGPHGPAVPFPAITVRDMVHVQRRLLDRLGVFGPVSLIGGSIGGFQVLDWLSAFPDRVRHAIAIGCGVALPAEGLAFNAIGRRAITADPRWRGGVYPADDPPRDGLAIARQIGHVTYRSAASFDERFGRRRQPGFAEPPSLDRVYAVESYLDHQADRFVDRFDAASYVTLTRAMDHFEWQPPAGGRAGGNVSDDRAPATPVHAAPGPAAPVPTTPVPTNPVRATPVPATVIGFDHDWLFPPAAVRSLADRLQATPGIRARCDILPGHAGHDCFLMEHDGLADVVRGAIAEAAET